MIKHLLNSLIQLALQALQQLLVVCIEWIWIGTISIGNGLENFESLKKLFGQLRILIFKKRSSPKDFNSKTKFSISLLVWFLALLLTLQLIEINQKSDWSVCFVHTSLKAAKKFRRFKWGSVLMNPWFLRRREPDYCWQVTLSIGDPNCIKSKVWKFDFLIFIDNLNRDHFKMKIQKGKRTSKEIPKFIWSELRLSLEQHFVPKEEYS